MKYMPPQIGVCGRHRCFSDGDAGRRQQPAAERAAYRREFDANLEVSCLMLASMEPELQMQFKTNHEAHDMIVALQDMFQTQARTERFNVSKAFV